MNTLDNVVIIGVPDAAVMASLAVESPPRVTVINDDGKPCALPQLDARADSVEFLAASPEATIGQGRIVDTLRQRLPLVEVHMVLDAGGGPPGDLLEQSSLNLDGLAHIVTSAVAILRRDGGGRLVIHGHRPDAVQSPWQRARSAFIQTLLAALSEEMAADADIALDYLTD